MNSINTQSPAFLGVEHSARGFYWQDSVTDLRQVQTLEQKLGFPEILARILVARNIDLDSAAHFLTPTIKELMPNPDLLQDMSKGADRLIKAIERKENIAIFGDYDVDGATSTALMHRYLEHFSSTALVYIPDRETEGYGPNIEAIEKLKSQNITLIIMVDCGTRAYQPLKRAKELGMDVVVLDHHQTSEELPESYALINPNRQDDVSGQYHLAACGVTFLFLASVNKKLREREQENLPDLMNMLDLVALGTICDLVPLKGVNRAFAAQGFKVMAAMGNIGLARLSEVVNMRRKPDTYVAGFMFGPRINAAGRMGASDLGARLLFTQNAAEASQIARELDTLNGQRKSIEQDVFLKASHQAEQMMGQLKNISALVTSGANWHPGVIGIVAGRLKEKFNLPSLVISFKNGVGTGSARSVEGVDLGKLITKAVDEGILLSGGGHAMAAGLKIEQEKLPDLRHFFETEISTHHKSEKPKLKIDGAVNASGATVELLELIDKAGPYGMGHPRPRFVFPAHMISYADIAGDQHVKCRVRASDGSTLKAIAFRAMDTPLGDLLLSRPDTPIHLVGHLSIDDWGGKRVPQLFIEDAALDQSSDHRLKP